MIPEPIGKPASVILHTKKPDRIKEEIKAGYTFILTHKAIQLALF